MGQFFVLVQHEETGRKEVLQVNVDDTILTEGNQLPEGIRGKGWLMRHVYDENTQRVLAAVYNIMSVLPEGDVVFEKVVLNITEGGGKVRPAEEFEESNKQRRQQLLKDYQRILEEGGVNQETVVMAVNLLEVYTENLDSSSD